MQYTTIILLRPSDHNPQYQCHNFMHDNNETELGDEIIMWSINTTKNRTPKGGCIQSLDYHKEYPVAWIYLPKEHISIPSYSNCFVSMSCNLSSLGIVHCLSYKYLLRTFTWLLSLLDGFGCHYIYIPALWLRWTFSIV